MDRKPFEKIRKYDVQLVEDDDGSASHVAVPYTPPAPVPSVRSSTTTTTTTTTRHLLVVPRQSSLMAAATHGADMTLDEDDNDTFSIARQQLDRYDAECARQAGFTPLAVPDSKKRRLAPLVLPNKDMCVEVESDARDDAYAVRNDDNDSETIHTEDSFTSQGGGRGRPPAARARRRLAPGADEASSSSSSSSSEDPETRGLRLARMRSQIHVRIENPFLAMLTREYGPWVPPKYCLGCKRDLIRHTRLIDEEIAKLVTKLDTRLNDGICSAINWAGCYFTDNLFKFYRQELDANDLPLWEKWCAGINIIGHFMQHSHYETLKQKFKGIQTEFLLDLAYDTACYRTLNDPLDAVRVDGRGASAVARLELLQVRLKNGKPEQSCFYESTFSRSDKSDESRVVRAKRTNTQV